MYTYTCTSRVNTQARDALAAALFRALFAWLVEQVNRSVSDAVSAVGEAQSDDDDDDDDDEGGGPFRCGHSG